MVRYRGPVLCMRVQSLHLPLLFLFINFRVGRAMNKLLRGGGYKILNKMIKIWHFEQNRKNGSETLSVRTKSKMVENHEKMFLVKILTKIDFLERFLFFPSHPSLQNMKNMAAKSMAMPRTSKTQKHIDLFLHFFRTPVDHWTSSIDRARSQLFRTFFLASLRSF